MNKCLFSFITVSCYFVFVDSYNSILAYGQSKLANILHSSELSSRLKVPTLSFFFFQMIKVDMLSVGRLPFMDLLYWKRKVEEVAGGGR